MYALNSWQGTTHVNETYRVVFRHEAVQDLRELYDYIAGAGSPDAAIRYTEAIVAHCEDLSTFPYRGSSRNEIRPGLRTIGYKKRVVIAFVILDDTVAILGIYYGGRNFEVLIPELE